eukprot:scaffold288439_cov27-Tisochrysis_lutea.AAC.2
MWVDSVDLAIWYETVSGLMCKREKSTKFGLILRATRCLTFASTVGVMIFTSSSMLYSEVKKTPLGRWLYIRRCPDHKEYSWASI